MQLFYNSFIRHNPSLDNTVVLNNDAYLDLLWWSKCPDNLPPSPMREYEADVSLYCDASLIGWGGFLSSGQHISGKWSSSHRKEHINYLELKAIQLCLSTFLPLIKNKIVHIHSDNSTAVYYINKIGGTHSRGLCLLALDIVSFLINNKIFCKAFHIAGLNNTLADKFSRIIDNDYGLDNVTFSYIVNLSPFLPTVDLFASSDFHLLQSYVSWYYDAGAICSDAFSFKWPDNCYAFPPISLISKVVQKFIADEIQNLLLVTPLWSGLLSLPIIIEHLISSPILIDQSSLIGCLPTRHPFHMMAWPISTNVEKR